ncbi:DpnII family type II restriction endonuclease [Flavobacterium ajazii]|uniref:DpnII family type II restriction endonuclease n=1 Tax=Flavobacterium ajazii TaxID=2692318 RepID=UPI0013D64D8A|nr:DpnII family type II restriction endonuclease [Flavobacterium ajazii]
MQKISFEEWKNSMSFMIDDVFDNNFLQSIKPLTQFINDSSGNLSSTENLSKFLTIDDDNFNALIKLKALVSLIGLSEERLKRVVSLLRYRIYKEEFNTEWDIKRISKTMQQNIEFKNILIDFFLNGRFSKIGHEIPLYYMRNFKLKDKEFISDLSNYSYVQRILNDNEIQGKYSNEVGAHVETLIKNKIEDYKKRIKPDLTYETQKEYPLFNKNIDFLIPSLGNPILLMESSYNITTGSGQSKRADQLVELYGILMRHNANHRGNRITMINYCDGFGWVGRQNDLNRIYNASDYVINQKNINQLDEILSQHLK